MACILGSGSVSVGLSDVGGVVYSPGVRRMTWQRGRGRPCDVVVVVALLGVIAHPRAFGMRYRGCRM